MGKEIHCRVGGRIWCWQFAYFVGGSVFGMGCSVENETWAVGYSVGGPNEAISVTIRDRGPGQATLKDIFVQSFFESPHNLESYIRHEDFLCPLDSFFFSSVTLRVPPLDSETGWTGELWSNCVFLILENY